MGSSGCRRSGFCDGSKWSHRKSSRPVIYDSPRPEHHHANTGRTRILRFPPPRPPASGRTDKGCIKMKRFTLSALTLLTLIGSATCPALASARGIDDHSGDPAYAHYYHQPVSWGACPPSLFTDGSTIQCALVTVPVDWADPTQGDITIG